jgi:WD40 repeat protein
VTSVAISGDGMRIVSGSDDCTVRMWTMDGELLHTWKTGRASVSSVALSKDGNRVVAAAGKTIWIWEMAK